MRTILDDANWFLHGIFAGGGEVRVYVAEAIKASEPDELLIGGKSFGPTHAMKVTAKSRYFRIRFEKTIAWQSIEESYTTWDDYEEGDDGVARVFSKSRFLDFLHAHHGWLFDMEKGVRHHRIWTYDQVIDVASTSDPTIEPWSPDL